jgi:hypothetical protein
MKRLILSLGLLGAAASASAQSGAAPAPSQSPPGNDVASRIAQIEEPREALDAAAVFRHKGDLALEELAWSRAAQLRPHIGRYRLEQAAAMAQQDKKTAAYHVLLELQTQGYGFDLHKDRRFDKINMTEVWDYVLAGLDANRKPYGEGKVAYTLPKQNELIESVAWDATRKQLLAGSARDGAVYRVGANGALTALVTADKENGMWAVFDLVVDAKRGVLWVASTAVPHYRNYNAETDLGRAGIFKFDLETGKFLKKFLSPSMLGQSFFLSTIALGKDGEVYAADGVNNAVYQVRDDKLTRLFHAPKLGSIRGLTVSEDGRTLFLGDHERGLIGYELATGKPFDVGVPKTLSLGGIEGIAWWQGHLIVVQSDMQPTRIMRIRLSENLRDVAAAHQLAASQPDMPLPTLGALSDDSFYVIANSQKGNYDRFGLLKDKSLQQPTRIYRVDPAYKPKKPEPTMMPAQSN